MSKSNQAKSISERGVVSFGSKAETLERLADCITTATVLPQVRFSRLQWNQSADFFIKRVTDSRWLSQGVIVRSSCLAEDQDGASGAGRFLSVLDVRNEKDLRDAVKNVFASYPDASVEGDQVFVQPMIQEVERAGVLFSCDPNLGSRYAVINFDESGSTASITSGTASTQKTFFYYRNNRVECPKALRPLIALLEELETLLDCETLDIEFAINRSGEVFLLQCRSLAGFKDFPPVDVKEHLENIEKKVGLLQKPHPYLFGERSVFGVMPDWNPAEIIGTRPRPLALSLYKELITDSIWAYQRDNYGYRNLRSFPLLINFCGLPYIDVRVSFNSFVPKDIGEELGEKLVNYYIDRLAHSPTLHDKVEFDVLFTCYTLDLPTRIKTLREKGFSESECTELEESLRKLTNLIIGEKKGLWRQDIEKIAKLEKRIDVLNESDLDPVNHLYWLMEDCKRYGTLPFAGLARAGFIAVQLLRSMVAVGILTQKEHDAFLASLKTVGSQMGTDFYSLKKEDFLKKYGHLRPGTYDILSPRYDENPDRYFDWSKKKSTTAPTKEDFGLSLEQLRKTEQVLKEHRVEYSAIGFYEFIQQAIEGREYAKFVFTRSLSDGLTLFKGIGKSSGLAAEACSFADIQVIRELYASSRDTRKVLNRSIAKGKSEYEVTRRVSLPPLILGPKDVWVYEIPSSDPNFITQNSVSGKIAFSDSSKEELKGAILMLPNADPGFDWIFAQGIKGFITMYGGVNSHMAIRAAEMGIPAVVGAGEKLYAKWANASALEVDCSNRKVRVLQ